MELHIDPVGAVHPHLGDRQVDQPSCNGTAFVSAGGQQFTTEWADVAMLAREDH